MNISYKKHGRDQTLSERYTQYGNAPCGVLTDHQRGRNGGFFQRHETYNRQFSNQHANKKNLDEFCPNDTAGVRHYGVNVDKLMQAEWPENQKGKSKNKGGDGSNCLVDLGMERCQIIVSKCDNNKGLSDSSPLLAKHGIKNIVLTTRTKMIIK